MLQPLQLLIMTITTMHHLFAIELSNKAKSYVKDNIPHLQQIYNFVFNYNQNMEILWFGGNQQGSTYFLPLEKVLSERSMLMSIQVKLVQRVKTFSCLPWRDCFERIKEYCLFHSQNCGWCKHFTWEWKRNMIKYCFWQLLWTQYRKYYFNIDPNLVKLGCFETVNFVSWQLVTPRILPSSIIWKNTWE